MKVILSTKSVYPFHPVGGVQKYVYYFAKHLSRKGLDLEIVAPLDDGEPRTEIYDGLKYTFLKPTIYHYLEYPIGWLGVHLFSRALNRYLQKISFDVLHSFDLTGYRYANHKQRKPAIAHIFSDNYLINPISWGASYYFQNFTADKYDQIKLKKIALSPFAPTGTKLKYLMQYLFKTKPMHRCLKQVESIFFEADIFKDEVNALYRLDPGKSQVIPVGIDIPFIRKALVGSKVTRGDLGLGKDDTVLITVNRLAADKGVDQIVLALEKIVKEITSVKLIIIGTGYQEKEILEMIKQKGLKDYVRHFKNVSEDDLFSYYKMSDIYLSVFSYPGSSISTLEAMACSLPVITTAQPWMIEGDRNGCVLKDNSYDAIKDAVIRLIRTGRLKEQGAVSREIVEDYDWEKIAEKAIQQYERILSERQESYEKN